MARPRLQLVVKKSTSAIRRLFSDALDFMEPPRQSRLPVESPPPLPRKLPLELIVLIARIARRTGAKHDLLNICLTCHDVYNAADGYRWTTLSLNRFNFRPGFVRTSLGFIRARAQYVKKLALEYETGIPLPLTGMLNEFGAGLFLELFQSMHQLNNLDLEIRGSQDFLTMSILRSVLPRLHIPKLIKLRVTMHASPEQALHYSVIARLILDHPTIKGLRLFFPKEPAHFQYPQDLLDGIAHLPQLWEINSPSLVLVPTCATSGAFSQLRVMYTSNGTFIDEHFMRLSNENVTFPNLQRLHIAPHRVNMTGDVVHALNRVFPSLMQLYGLLIPPNLRRFCKTDQPLFPKLVYLSVHRTGSNAQRLPLLGQLIYLKDVFHSLKAIDLRHARSGHTLFYQTVEDGSQRRFALVRLEFIEDLIYDIYESYSCPEAPPAVAPKSLIRWHRWRSGVKSLGRRLTPTF
ncbi:hypothetical protein SISNIDRAFT_490133 [Sistotremastrum niveocremeum HHB9708]|uniref:Uncharacterized protein n=2 Tax=Sistotremastraceae TaxID=3402574 RepID=A0A164PAY4_9AGAM|nr:hypothetical protein SISNIDRAFT_490133 [Sistotremastrum niveocremeum HHB9708]KZT32836.1 hypothetical protein SISSUDRAFT_1066628 [Sistotremastrum suecicum HHB10207 ss-3]